MRASPCHPHPPTHPTHRREAVLQHDGPELRHPPRHPPVGPEVVQAPGAKGQAHHDACLHVRIQHHRALVACVGTARQEERAGRSIPSWRSQCHAQAHPTSRSCPHSTQAQAQPTAPRPPCANAPRPAPPPTREEAQRGGPLDDLWPVAVSAGPHHAQVIRHLGGGGRTGGCVMVPVTHQTPGASPCRGKQGGWRAGLLHAHRAAARQRSTVLGTLTEPGLPDSQSGASSPWLRQNR